MTEKLFNKLSLGFKTRLKVINHIVKAQKQGDIQTQKKLLKCRKSEKSLNGFCKKYLSNEKNNLAAKKEAIALKISSYFRQREKNSILFSTLLSQLKNNLSTNYNSILYPNESIFKVSKEKLISDYYQQYLYLKNEILNLEIKRFVECVKYYHIVQDSDTIIYYFILYYKSKHILVSIDSTNIYYPLIYKIYGTQSNLFNEDQRNDRFFSKLPFKFLGNCEQIKYILEPKQMFLNGEINFNNNFVICHSCCLNYRNDEVLICEGEHKEVVLNDSTSQVSNEIEKIPKKFILQKNKEKSINLIVLNEYISKTIYPINMNSSKKNTMKSQFIKKKWLEIQNILDLLNETENDSEKLINLCSASKLFFSKNIKELFNFEFMELNKSGSGFEKKLNELLWSKSLKPTNHKKKVCGDYYCFICIEEFFDFKNHDEFICMTCNSKCHCHKCKNKESLSKKKNHLSHLQQKLKELKAERISSIFLLNDQSFFKEILFDSVIPIKKSKSNSTNIKNSTISFDTQIYNFCYKDHLRMRDLIGSIEYSTKEGKWASFEIQKSIPNNSKSILKNNKYFKLNPEYFQMTTQSTFIEERELLLKIAKNEIKFKESKMTKEVFLKLISQKSEFESKLEILKWLKKKAFYDKKLFE